MLAQQRQLEEIEPIAGAEAFSMKHNLKPDNQDDIEAIKEGWRDAIAEIGSAHSQGGK